MGIRRVSEKRQDRDGSITILVRSADTIRFSFKDTTHAFRVTHLIPSITIYLSIRYDPTRPQVLIAPARGVSTIISDQLDAALSSYYKNDGKSAVPQNKESKLQFAHIRSLYPKFQYSDIASHPAIVVLPYQVCPVL